MGVPVSFDAGGCSDPDSAIVAYAWDFGDGQTGSGMTPTHTYASAGTKTVTLTVTDADGLTDADTVQVTIELPVDDSLHVRLPLVIAD